jgi:acyl-CoA synthetase (AMP-forming)/AMP-acid ligase II
MERVEVQHSAISKIYTVLNNTLERIVQWDSEVHLSTDLVLIQYVVRRAIRHLLSLTQGKVSYWYIFERTVKHYPHNRAVSFADPTGLKGDDGFKVEEYTYQELYDMILKMSEVLVHRYGVSPGDTIALNFTNKPMFIILWFALWNIGATPAFLNYNNKGNPLVHCIKIAKVKQVFIDPKTDNITHSEGQIHKECPDVGLNYLDEDSLMTEIKDPNSIRFRQDDSRRDISTMDYDPAAFIYTSGTTGLPKSAIMSWRKAGFGASLYGYIVKLWSDCAVFTSMPLYHSTASMLGVCAAFNHGACVALSVKFSTSTIWTQIKLTKATHLQYVGEVCRYLLNSPRHPDERNHQLRCAYGNGLRGDIWMDFKTRFNINAIGEFYAATESPIALTSYQEGNYGIGACRNYGRLINSILQFQQTIIKMDPEDNSNEYRDPKTGLCKVACVDEPGELIMNLFTAKNPQRMFQGYLGNPKETESKIIRDVFRKGDAWFRSGDLLKSDSEGLWYFVDRLGDTFRWKSENVSTNEVEHEFIKVDGIKETVIVGVKVPNHEGRAGFAILELHDGIEHDHVLSQILKKLELPRYAVPIFVKFEKIKHTDNHKVLKKPYKDQRLPKGEGEDQIYWLKGNEYLELTEQDWKGILEGRLKI